MPSRFIEVNSESEITRTIDCSHDNPGNDDSTAGIHNQWSVYRARDKSAIEVHKLFISRLAIYSAVWEVMQSIYELDDAPQSAPWMKYDADAARKKKLILWRGVDAYGYRVVCV